MHGNINRKVTQHSTPMQCGIPGTDLAYLCLIDSRDVRHFPNDFALEYNGANMVV